MVNKVGRKLRNKKTYFICDLNEKRNSYFMLLGRPKIKYYSLVMFLLVYLMPLKILRLS